MAGTRRDGTILVLAAGILLSVLLHAVAYVGLAFVEEARFALQPRSGEVEVVIEEREPEPPEPTEPPEPPPEPEPSPAAEPRDVPEPPERRPEPPQPPSRPEPKPEPEPEQDPPPAKEEPADFTGETLSNKDGSWSVAPGSGEDREGPLPAPGQSTGRRRDGQPEGAPGGRGEAAARGPRVVPVDDLSAPPAQPTGVRRHLEQYYPERAKQQGVEAVARVRLRINADGSLGPMRTESESLSGYGFGEACERALRRAGQWSPPRDRSGRAVATWITYKCTFVVR